MKNTWVKLYRSLINDTVFDDPEVLKVWIWILCKVCYKNEIQIVKKQVVNLEPGQMIVESRKDAAELLRISENKYRKSIQILEDLGCITKKTTNKFTLINVMKWGFFQGGTEENHQQTTNKPPTNHQQTTSHIYKKNIKNNKNIYNISSTSARARESSYPQTMGGTIGKGVLILTDEQMDNLLSIMPIDVFDRYSEKLSSWIVDKGRKVDDHYGLIMKWFREDYGGEKCQGNTKTKR